MHHILCERPFILRDFYAIRPLILWHILGGIFFANMGGGGGQNYFQSKLREPVGHLQGSLGRGGPEAQKKSEKSLP